MSGKLIILDRDGVINADSPDYIRSADEWEPLPGSLDAIAALTQRGYRLVVATNQSGVGRGYFDIEALHHIHRKMLDAAASHGGIIEAVFFCPHRPEDNCACRKPAPGLLEQIADRLHHGLADVPVVGDSLRDIEAARAAGALPVLVRTGNGSAAEAQVGDDVPVFDDLAAFAADLLQRD